MLVSQKIENNYCSESARESLQDFMEIVAEY